MEKRNKKRKCPCCKEYFILEPRNAWHQEYCRKPECRKASKTASQQRWLQKKENKDYFRGSANVQRVQKWRKAHPGYWRKKASCNKNALQDLLPEKTEQKQPVTSTFESSALQDFLSPQPAVLIGLIAQITGTTLQDDIAISASRLRQLGNDILNFKGGEHDTKTSHIPR